MATIDRKYLDRLLYDNIEQILPEMDFKDKVTCKESILHWETLSNNGKKPKNARRSVVYRDDSASHKVGIIYDNGGENISIVDCFAYLRHGDSNVDGQAWYQYVKEILTLIGRSDLISSGTSRSSADDDFKDIPTPGDEAIDIFHQALLDGKSEEALKVRKYLTHDRGLTPGIIKAAKLGVVTTDLIASIDDKDLHDGLTIHPNIGKHNILAIPYIYDQHTNNIVTRRIDSVKELKYLNAFQHLPSFAHIKRGMTKITVVEGWLDAAPAQAVGLTDVVASGTNRANWAQMEDAIKRGVNEFTLLLDNDAGGDVGTPETAKKLVQNGKKVYIAKYPSDVKDLGDFFKARIKSHVVVGDKPDKVEKGKAYSNDPYFDQKLASLLRDDYQREIYERRISFDLYYVESILMDTVEVTYKQQGKAYDRIVLDDEAKSYVRLHSTESTRRRTVERLAEHLSNIKDDITQDQISSILQSWQEPLMFFVSSLWSLSDKRSDEAISKAVQKAIQEADSCMRRGDKDAALTILRNIISQNPDRKMEREYLKALRAFRGMQGQDIDAVLANVVEGKHTQFIFSDGTIGGTEYLTINTGLTFIVANTGHGKTSFLNNLALHRSKRNLTYHYWKNKTTILPKVLYFSLEVNKVKLTTDLLTTFVNDPDANERSVLTTTRTYIRTNGESNYFKTDLRPDKLTHEQFFLKRKQVFYDDYLSTGAITVVDTPYPLEQLIECIKLAKNKDDIDMILIDYAQLVTSMTNSKSRVEEIKDICKTLKDLAEEIKVPIVLAAQFNRQADSLADLALNKIGESGDFERVADTVIVLYNMKYITPKKSEGKDKEVDCIRALKQVGITPPVTGLNGNGYSILTPYDGLIYARILKRRDGNSNLSAVLGWIGKTKYIMGNANLAVYDPEFMHLLGKTPTQCVEAVKASEAYISEVVTNVLFDHLEATSAENARRKGDDDDEVDESPKRIYLDLDKKQCRGGEYHSVLGTANGGDTEEAKRANLFWMQFASNDNSKEDDSLELTDNEYFNKYDEYPVNL